jgi:hypothetical protein
MDKYCVKCGHKFEFYGCGLCYSCLCNEYQEGKRDKWGRLIETENKKRSQKDHRQHKRLNK